MEHYHEVPVFVQETNEVITVTLSAEQLEAVKADENCLQQFVADSFSFQQTSKRGRADVPIQSSTGEVQSRTEHVEPKTEQVHLDQENRTEKETVDHNSERTDDKLYSFKRKKKYNAIDILGEIQKSNNDFRVYLEKNRKEMKKD
nr:unnamed protein product [Callosobruchus analis]